MIQWKATPLQPPAAPKIDADRESNPVEGSCPYLERNDHRCSSRFSLGQMGRMLETCLGPRMIGCFMYQRLKREHEQGPKAGTTSTRNFIEPTHDGRTIPPRSTDT